MEFRNKDTDALRTRWGLVEPGQTVVVTADEAVGLVLQCGEDGRWEPADDDAVAAVDEATRPADEAPAESATKAVWVAYAEAHGIKFDPKASKADVIAAVQAAPEKENI